MTVIDEKNKVEYLILKIMKLLLMISITMSIASVIIEISFMDQYIISAMVNTSLLGINLLEFLAILALFMIPVIRLSIMAIEFYKSGNYINGVTESVVLIIILVLAARIVI
ncbi:MAG: hypothetical protein MK229_04550 [Nitrososphaerales archaeon]|nr:hypothetical protein [Nitrososphaerales archaeon]